MSKTSSKNTRYFWLVASGPCSGEITVFQYESRKAYLLASQDLGSQFRPLFGFFGTKLDLRGAVQDCGHWHYDVEMD